MRFITRPGALGRDKPSQRTGTAIGAAKAVTLCGLFLRRVARTPNAVAYLQFDPLTGGWTQTTWQVMAREVARWQAALRREPLRPGDRVAVMMGNRREWVAFELAASGLGLVTVPIAPGSRPEFVHHILADAGARLLLLEHLEQRLALAEIEVAVRRLDRVLVLDPGAQALHAGTVAGGDWLDEAWDGGAVPVDRVGDTHALATIVYSAEMTGAPKGVMLSHRNILWNAEASLRLVPVDPSDRFLSLLPISNALERTAGCILPIMAGCSVAFARSISLLAEDLVAIRPTAIIAVPKVLERIHARLCEHLVQGTALRRWLFARAVGLGWRRFEHSQGRADWHPELLLAPWLSRLVGARARARLGGRLRIAVCSGAPLFAEVARVLIALGVPVLQGYGLAEAGPLVSVNRLEDNRLKSVGEPLPGVEIRQGADDELLVRSPGVMLGYWRQPQATAAVLDAQGWLHTGDQVARAFGHLFINGRVRSAPPLSVASDACARRLVQAPRPAPGESARR